LRKKRVKVRRSRSECREFVAVCGRRLEGPRERNWKRKRTGSNTKIFMAE
jgi:hypothetical protein